MVDVCIISDAKNTELMELTMNGIETLLRSEEGLFRIYVVESNNDVIYQGVQMIYTDLPFGYNKYLNLAVGHGDSEYVCLCNNDLVYEKGWASAIIEEMGRDPSLMSASPFCPEIHEKNNGPNVQIGYQIKYKVAGWCIFQQRRIYDKIDRLDESVEFWYSDNAYARQLMRARIKHGLVMNSVVHHHDKLLGATAETLAPDERKRMTVGQRRLFV